MSNEFQTTDTLGRFISAVGWVLVGIAVIVALGLATGGGTKLAIAGIVLVLGGVLGVLTVVQGQLLQIMVAIERNTAGSSAAAPQKSYYQDESSSTTCTGCGKVYQGNLSGQFCEDCGAKM